MEKQRIIKFRFWNTIARRFQPDLMYSIMGNGKLLGFDFEVGDWGDEVEFDRTCIVAQQFTGLRDVNGKEIYEGDICKAFNTEMIGLVEFNSDFKSYAQYIGFKFKCYKINGDPFLNSFSNAIYQPFGRGSNFYEVIGNIFENSELLKK